MPNSLSNISQSVSQSVIFRTNPIIFRTNPGICRTNPVIFILYLVITKKKYKKKLSKN